MEKPGSWKADDFDSMRASYEGGKLVSSKRGEAADAMAEELQKNHAWFSG